VTPRRLGGAKRAKGLVVLDEPNVLGVLAEALPADVQVVLANDTPLVRADSAVREGGEGQDEGCGVSARHVETLEMPHLRTEGRLWLSSLRIAVRPRERRDRVIPTPIKVRSRRESVAGNDTAGAPEARIGTVRAQKQKQSRPRTPSDGDPEVALGDR